MRARKRVMPRSPLDRVMGRQLEQESQQAGKAHQEGPLRHLSGRVPAELWDRLDAYSMKQPKGVAKERLLTEAVEEYLAKRGA